MTKILKNTVNINVYNKMKSAGGKQEDTGLAQGEPHVGVASHLA
jgi:hypothetical protein